VANVGKEMNAPKGLNIFAIVLGIIVGISGLITGAGLVLYRLNEGEFGVMEMLHKFTFIPYFKKWKFISQGSRV